MPPPSVYDGEGVRDQLVLGPSLARRPSGIELGFCQIGACKLDRSVMQPLLERLELEAHRVSDALCPGQELDGVLRLRLFRQRRPQTLTPVDHTRERTDVRGHLEGLTKQRLGTLVVDQVQGSQAQIQERVRDRFLKVELSSTPEASLEKQLCLLVVAFVESDVAEIPDCGFEPKGVM